jgi:hypothetical protein
MAISVVLMLCPTFASVASAEVGEGPYYTTESERLEESETLAVKAKAKESFVITTSKGTITCTGLKFKEGATIAGSSGPNGGTSNETFEFSGCTVTGNGATCKVEGEKFSTNALVNKLGFSTSTKSGKVLVLYQPKEGKAIATPKFSGTCTVTSTTIEGSLVGEEFVAGKVVEVGGESAGEKNEVHFTTTKTTIWTESSEALTENSPTLSAFGASATFKGVAEEELLAGLVWGGEARERVWWVGGAKLTTLVPPEKTLAGAASLSGFELVGRSGPKPTINCTGAKTASGTIKNRIEVNTELIFEGCTVTSPENCQVGEEKVVGKFRFKSLEGKLEYETVTFRERVLGTPIAKFELTGTGCTEAGIYKVTGTFKLALRTPENAEAEKKALFNDEREVVVANLRTTVFTLASKNESMGTTGEFSIVGELGLKLNPNANWNTGLP